MIVEHLLGKMSYCLTIERRVIVYCLLVKRTDIRPRSAPALELISRAVSSVGVMYRFQQSQHRKKSQRRTDTKKTVITRIQIETYFKLAVFCTVLRCC